jgi:hypothetical protein
MFKWESFQLVIRWSAPGAVKYTKVSAVEASELDQSGKFKAGPPYKGGTGFCFVFTEGFTDQGHTVGADLGGHKARAEEFQGATLAASRLD